jgi:hypothetical protein
MSARAMPIAVVAGIEEIVIVAADTAGGKADGGKFGAG